MTELSPLETISISSTLGSICTGIKIRESVNEVSGACGSCPSSTTTMKMGIEQVLKKKFGEAVKDIRQVSDDLQNAVTPVEAVNGHLDVLRPAIKNYVEVVSVEGGDCHVRYVGPASIGSRIRLAIRQRFPDIVNVVLTS